MPTVTAAFVHALAKTVGLSLHPDGTVLSDAVPVLRLSPLPDGRIGDREFFELIDWIETRHYDRVALVDAYARSIRMDDLGVLGLAIKAAPTLRASLVRLERYFRLLTDTATYRLDETGPEPQVVLEICTGDHRALSLRNECALAGLVHNARAFVDGPLAPVRVSFRHASRCDPARYAATFGCPVIFGADRDAVVLSEAALRMPNRLGDDALSDYLTRHLDTEFGTVSAGSTLRDDLCRRLSSALSTGVPQAATLARDMGMSERTFFRRLSDEGTTFRDVVQDVQIGLARELLQRGDCSIAEVAFLTGFSEQSSFGRAFKRRVGQAPAQYRSAALGTPRGQVAETVQRLAGRVDTGERATV
ncbi:AraC family transcriptional regulator ligand-binding domain-containing protein [Tropicibacter sp. S64]|uniref:AraC family transcriptional regulator n=1 Tax=Tropicibacter sp. S64 TaxID=3415122 RepID=UPI003C7E4375